MFLIIYSKFLYFIHILLFFYLNIFTLLLLFTTFNIFTYDFWFCKWFHNFYFVYLIYFFVFLNLISILQPSSLVCYLSFLTCQFLINKKQFHLVKSWKLDLIFKSNIAALKIITYLTPKAFILQNDYPTNGSNFYSIKFAQL